MPKWMRKPLDTHIIYYKMHKKSSLFYTLQDTFFCKKKLDNTPFL